MHKAQIACAALLVLTGCSHKPVLSVCADPNNLPFSNRAGQGIENRVAEIVARDLGAELRYEWWSQRRGFVRNTIGAGTCDVWMGVPAIFERTLTTRPYYGSTYVFVTRASSGLGGLTFDDPRLRSLDIGVPLAGDDGVNPPPADALARRGLLGRMHGYLLYGDYREPDPPAALLRDLADGKIDVAIVWGPLAGWYAARAGTPLRVEAVRPSLDGGLPMKFAIAVGVSKREPELRDRIDRALERNRTPIARVIAAYHVPVAPVP